jgi:hypothetical protein
MRTLFLQAPSFDGFDGGAGSRYQARREIRSFWYPTWLRSPQRWSRAASSSTRRRTAGSRRHPRTARDSISPSCIRRAVVRIRRQDDRGDEGGESRSQGGLIGAKVAVDPSGSLSASQAIDFVAGNEFDFTIKEVPRAATGRIAGLSWRNGAGAIVHNRRPRDAGEHGRAAVRHAGVQARPRRSRTTSSAT